MHTVRLDRNGPHVSRISLGCLATAQAAAAWVSAQGSDIVPLLGTHPTQADLAEIERAAPKGSGAGPRYNEHQMAMLDSEN